MILEAPKKQPSIGQRFGQAFASLGQELPSALTQFGKDKELEKKKGPKPYSVFDIYSNLQKLGLSKDQLSLLSPDDLVHIASEANQGIGTYGKEGAFVKAFKNQFSPQSFKQFSAGSDSREAPVEQPEGFRDALSKGFQSSISGRLGALSQGESLKDFEERTRLKKGGWFNNLLYNLAKFGGDFPYYGAGATAGGAAGGVAGAPFGPFGAAAGATLGGGAGALAFPAMVEKGLVEYQKYLENGGKGTFGDFLKSAEKVLESGIAGGAEGAALGPLMELKVLSKIPQGKKLLNMRGGKAIQKLIDTGAQAGVFTGAQGLAEGKIPSLEDYGQNLALFLGMDLLQNSGKYSKEIYQDLKKAAISPQEAAQKISQHAEASGNPLQTPEQIRRAFKDITAESSKEKQVAKEEFGQRPFPELEPQEMAARLAERPIEEYLERERKAKEKKEKPLTEKEKIKREAAQKELKVVNERLNKVREEVEYLRDRLRQGGLSSDKRRLGTYALEQKEKLFESLNERAQDLKGLSEKGVKPFREKDLAKDIDKHLEDLSIAAEHPHSATAKDLHRMFERDQKYIDKFFDLAEKGKIPEVKFKDRYIKILDTYYKGYKEAMKRAENFYSDMGQFSEGLMEDALRKEKSIMDKYRNLLEQNMDINQAKIANQKDKLNSLAQLKKPFVKQYLKKFRNDLKGFEKDFIKQVKLEGDLKKKLDNVVKHAVLEKSPKFSKAKLKNAREVAQKLENKKFDSKEAKVAEAFDISKTKLGKLVDRFKPEIAEIIKDFKTDPSKGINHARRLYRHLPFKYQVAAGSLISAALAEAGVPYYVRFWFIPSNSIIRGLATGIGGVLRDKYHQMIVDSYVKELAEHRKNSLTEGINYVDKMNKKLSPSEVKKVLKKYNEIRTSL